jgi:uncharacterized protein (DUF305 family)
MKKVISVVVLFFAFTLGATAQDLKVNADEAAKKDVAVLLSKITVSENLKKDFYTLMVMKHEALAKPKLTAAEKENISKIFENKLMAALTEDQRKELAKYPSIMKQLAN